MLSAHFLRFRIFTLLFCTVTAAAHSQPADTVGAKKEGYIASYWTNSLGVIASPLHWNGDDWAKVGGTLAVTGAIISMDEAISQPFFNWQTDFGKAFGNTGRFVGSVPFELGITGAALAAGTIAHNKPLQEFALDNLQAQIFIGGLTWAVKEIAHRARPYKGEGAYNWKGPFKTGGNDYNSFFSGHASLSFGTATMVFLHSGKKWWVGLISYSLAGGIAISRMQRQSHWASDVVLGSVVGSSVAGFVYKQQQKRRNAARRLKTIP